MRLPRALEVALLACLVPAGSCGFGSTTYVLDANLTTEQRAGADIAKLRWNAWAKAQVIDLEDSGSDGDWTIIQAVTKAGWNGEVDRDLRIIRLNPGGDAPAAAVLVHEIGHTFGMRDLAPGLDGVMSAERVAEAWSEHDQRECIARGPCD